MLDSRKLPTRAMLVRLIEAFDAAPRPFMLKCSGGQDRTSFAAALYLIHRGGWHAFAQASGAIRALSLSAFSQETSALAAAFPGFRARGFHGAPLGTGSPNSYDPERLKAWLDARGHGRSLCGIFSVPDPQPAISGEAWHGRARACSLARIFLPPAQKALLDAVLQRLEDAPLLPAGRCRARAKPFSVEESNFGALGWVADKTGYRYQATHPVTGKAWPDIPPALLALWDDIAAARRRRNAAWSISTARARAWACTRTATRTTLAAPVVWCRWATAPCSASAARHGAARPERHLVSGDVVMFGGEARLAYHGIDRILPGTSTLVPAAGGSISLCAGCAKSIRLPTERRPESGGGAETRNTRAVFGRGIKKERPAMETGR